MRYFRLNFKLTESQKAQVKSFLDGSVIREDGKVYVAFDDTTSRLPDWLSVRLEGVEELNIPGEVHRCSCGEPI